MGAVKAVLKKLQRAELSPAQQEKLGVLAAKNPEFGDAAKFMLPGEVASSVRGSNPEKITALMRSMSTYQQLASAAKSAAGKRGWYRASADALHETFGDDAPRFTSLLAALSPQTSVETNMVHALKIWNRWVDAGRPQDPKQIAAIMGSQVQGTRGEASVLDAWKNNSIRALTSEIPVGDRKFRVPMSGSKVNSFTANLLGDVYEVTNDAWQSKLLFGHGKQLDDHYRSLGLKVTERNAGWTPQSLYKLTTDDPQPGTIPKGPGYVASNVVTRQAADSLGMTPDQLQASAWTFGKQLTEAAERTGMRERDVLQKGLLTTDMLNTSTDFSTMMRDPKYRGLLNSGHPDIQLSAERAGALQQAPIGAPMPLTLADENRQLQIAKQLERARGITKGVAPVATAGALSAAALTPEDAEAGLTSRLPKWMGEAEMRRWANAREDAASALAKGEDLDKVFKETGWAPDYDSSVPLPWDAQRDRILREQELSSGRVGAGRSLNMQGVIEPLLVREFDTFGSRVPAMSDMPPQPDDRTTSALAQHIFLRGAPQRGPNAAPNLYRNVLGAQPLKNLLGKDAGLFREYPELLKSSYTGQGGIGAAVYHAESKDPAKMLFTFGPGDPRIVPPGETDPLRSFIEHEAGYHAPQGIDGRMSGRRNLFDYVNDPTEVSARAGQSRLHPTVRTMESPRSTMDRYAQTAKGGAHHPQETYPTQGKLFGGAAGTSLVGAGTATGILAAPADANAGARSTTTSPGILDGALSMLAGGMSPDTANEQISEQRDQIYDFIVGAPAQFAGGVVDTGQAVGAGLWQQSAMSDPAFQQRTFGGGRTPPADRNPIWNAENIPGGTDWNMRKLGANPQSGGALMGMVAGGVMTPANWVGRVKQAGQYLGDTPWISKIIDKTMDAPVFRKPVKRLDEVNITDEHVPGVPGHMDDMKNQPENVRNLYSMVGRAQEHRGRNPFYADQQQFGVERAVGDYTNKDKVREHNTVYRTMLDSTTPESLLAPRQHLRALIDAQEASAGHRINTNVPPSQVDAMRLDAGPQHGPDVMERVRKNIEGRGLATIDTGGGVTTLRSPFDKELSPRRVRGILSDITHSDIGISRGTLTEGKFESVFEAPAWSKQQGTGQAVDNWLANTADADFAGIDTQHLRDYVLGKRQLDDNISPLLGLKQREDIRKMRAMIGNMGIQGFRDFVRKNGSQGLPVVLLGGYLQQNETPQSALMENRT